MKVNIVVSMVLGGVIIYTAISSFAAALLAFYIMGVSMISGKALGLSTLIAGVLTGLFYLLTLWVRRDMVKSKKLSFPFIATLLSVEEEEGTMSDMVVDIDLEEDEDKEKEPETKD